MHKRQNFCPVVISTPLDSTGRHALLAKSRRILGIGLRAASTFKNRSSLATWLKRLPHKLLPSPLVVALGFCLVTITNSVQANIISVTTAVQGNKLNLNTVTISNLGIPNRTFTASQLIMPTLIDYQSIPESGNHTVTVLGTPDSPPPDGAARLNLISDAALNTGIFNPTGAGTGMLFQFPQPIVNGPGDDLVFFELSIGNETPDPFVVEQPEGTSFVILSGAYPAKGQGAIPAADFLTTYLATVATGANVDFSTLTSASLTASTAGNQKYNGVSIDLSLLGVPSGASINELNIRSRDGTRAVDPILFAALPTPEPSSLYLAIAGVALLLVIVRGSRMSL